MGLPLLSPKMKSIAMDILGAGGVVNDAGINIDSRKGPWYYDITCKFTGRKKNTNIEFGFYPTKIKSLIIKQDFIEDYLDHLDLECEISMPQLVDLYENYRDLKCTLLIRRYDEREQAVVDGPPFLYQTYLCIIINKEDLFLSIPKDNLIASEEGHHSQAHQEMFPTINLQLMDEESYNLRKRFVNLTLRQATMKQVMLKIADMCGIKQICMVPPDNETVYMNLVIPPAYKITNVFNYLQEHYGVYNKGISWYFTHDILYIYPPYETKQVTPVSAHLYYVGNNNFPGFQRYHASSDVVTHIVANMETRSVDLIDSGSEQLGTTLYVQHANRMIDNFFHIDNKEVLHIHNDNFDVLTNKDDTTGIISGTFNPEFVFDNSNEYLIKSQMSFPRRTIITTGWTCAVPYTFKPGWVVHYHYDNENKTDRADGNTISDNTIYTSRQGIVDMVRYVFGPLGRKGEDYMYGCNADIQLSVEMEEAKDVSKETKLVKTLSGDTTKPFPKIIPGNKLF